jgi:hypothetical protein
MVHKTITLPSKQNLMKNFTLFVTAILFNMSMLTGQISISSADMPNVGDTIRFSTASPASLTGLDFAQTGANHTWNFSVLTHLSQDIDTFVSVTSTPIFYYPSFITNASIARKGESFGAAGFTLTNVYDFFKETSAHFAQVGFAAQLSGVPLPTLYTAPDYQYRFPLSYGNSDSCLYGYSITIPTLFTYKNESKRINTIDGWGTITTPLGTFQALRVKSVIISRDSLASDSLPFPIPPITTTTTEYKWLTNSHRVPVLTVEIRGMGAANVTYPDIPRQNIGIAEAEGNGTTIPVSLYPNPAGNQLTIATTPKPEVISWIMIDALGSIVMQGKISDIPPETTLNIEALDAGVYYIRLIGKNGSTGSGRFVRL